MDLVRTCSAATTSAPLLLVLAGLQDPGNLGTILRSAEAFGATGVSACPEPSAPGTPKPCAPPPAASSAFRSSPPAAEECFARLRYAGVKHLTTAVRDGRARRIARSRRPRRPAHRQRRQRRPADLAAQADAALTIPCPGPVESLNAAVAASILLYEASRQRPPQRNPAAQLRAKQDPDEPLRR